MPVIKARFTTITLLSPGEILLNTLSSFRAKIFLNIRNFKLSDDFNLLVSFKD